jgi:hypothetical protein
MGDLAEREFVMAVIGGFFRVGEDVFRADSGLEGSSDGRRYLRGHDETPFKFIS